MDPRVAQTRRVARDAALAELAARGFGGVTVEGIAARSGIAKSTLYRHWPDAAALVRDAVVARPGQPPPVGDADRGRARVVAVLRHLVEALHADADGDALAALVDAARRDPGVGATFTTDNDRRRAGLAAAVAEAIEDGEVAAHVTDPEAAAVALAGAVTYRRLLVADPMRPEEVGALVTTVLGPVPDGGAGGGTPPTG